MCVIFIVVCVLLRITNENEKRSIKIFGKKRMLHSVHYVSILGRIKPNTRVVSRVGFGPKVDQNVGLNSGLRRTFCLR